MDFAQTPAQRRLCQAVRDFGQRELNFENPGDGPAVPFNREGWLRCARFGVLGWPVPKKYGGSGLDPLSTILALDALGYACRDNGLVFAVNNHLWACAIYLVEHGTPELCETYLPPMCEGRWIGAHALTEPGTGSDVLSMTMRAERAGDHYVLNGTKTFISNAPVADVFVVLARTALEGPRQQALSAFVVPAHLPGVRVGREWNKAGLHTTPMGEVVFTDCRVPARNLLGGEGDGYAVFTSTIEWERAFMFASQVGVMERILDDCVRYATTRRQFGRTLGGFDSISGKIADMKVRIDLARLLLHKIGWLKDAGRLAMMESAIAKLFISESHLNTALDAVQIHGARGYLTEFGIEREVRDALCGPIYGGTSEIQRKLIAGMLGIATGDETG
ncbi:acyl-CoA dehydrogenase family protein [Microbispora triticiradicis]|uniref:Acyl-CoA dehydrogenase n=2 Tax=Microbispora TaxID=2005 RepID=A0ABY3LNG7_9ACTN|nr:MULTISPECIES: acyl-CoA dehydrogenase family protein [Microbispora]TLP50902.1 acyl-CoA dehydrogenase [Microbispora fusca]TYB43744.1 acyl-CoA dehydrogenase [Microbispora tritici]